MGNRIVLWLICVVGGITALYLAWYNRMVDDDLVMWATLDREGILGATREHYNTWNTRWMSFLFLHTWMSFLRPDTTLFFYHLTTFTVLLLACWRLVRTEAAKENLRPEIRENTLLAAGLLSIALLICTFDIGDTWFWMNTSTMYGWNLIVFILALGLTLQPVKHSFTQESLLTFLGLYFGGAAEPAVGIYLLAVAGVYFFQREQYRKYSRHLINFSIGVAVGFLIAWFGTGHAKRDAALPDLDVLRLITKGGYFTLKIALYHLPLRLLLALPVLLSIWQSGKRYNRQTLLKNTVRIKLAGLILLACHTYFMVWIMGDYGPARAWSHISLLMLILTTAWILTTRLTVSDNLLRGLNILVLALLLYTCYQQTQVVPAYSEYLQNPPAHFEAAKVPESGMLHRRTM
jgi:hypothetical protein